jgi:adenine-specific DNA methylase
MSQENVYFAVRYTGTITGSYAGREDGYPETRTVFGNTLEELVSYFDKPDAKVFSLKEIPNSVLKLAKDTAEAAKLRKEQEENRTRQIAWNKLTADERRALGLTKSVQW